MSTEQSTNTATVKDPIIQLYNLIHIKDLDKQLKEGLELFKQVTSEALYENQKKYDHPILHEMAHQYLHCYPLFQAAYEFELLKPFWDNTEYVDEYKLTVLQQLASSQSDLERRKDRDYTCDLTFFKKIGIKPTNAIYSPTDLFGIKVENYRV